MATISPAIKEISELIIKEGNIRSNTDQYQNTNSAIHSVLMDLVPILCGTMEKNVKRKKKTGSNDEIANCL